jgi:hypothetical protein
MRPPALLLALGAVACDVASGLDDFAIVPGAAAGGSASSAGGAAGMGGMPGGGGDAGAGMGGSGGSVEAPPPCAIADAFDDDSVSPGLWMIEPALNASWVEGNGVLRLDVSPMAVDSRFTRLVSAAKHTVVGCTMQIHVGPTTVGDEAGEQLYFAAIRDPTNNVGFSLDQGSLYAGKTENSMVSAYVMPYDAPTPRYWRFWSRGTHFRFEMSPDGVIWELLREEEVGFDATLVDVVIAGGAPSMSPAAGGTVAFDDLNVPP